MKYISTRSVKPTFTFSEAMLNSLAPDGGLYVPDKIPKIPSELLAELPGSELASLGTLVLGTWLEQDILHKSLSKICHQAFNFPTPLVFMNEDTALLELFHGPTSAFKDVGARFLAESLGRLPESKGKTVLVATSGDTGGAVASAFFQKKGLEVVILYPRGKVSERQELQLSTWGENIHTFCVRGDFDDCQRMVKELLLDPQLEDSFLSANSINIGRLLPQTLYYAQSSLSYFEKTKRTPGIIVPTGNLGNALAALWAKKMGFPIREVVFATNQNRPIVDYMETGKWKAHKTLSTLANAMDVGNPSNIERLLYLYPNLTDLKKEVQAFSVSDAEISQTIKNGKKRWNKIFCPHTATAVFVREKLEKPDWIVVATAHPSKFETIVEPLIGEKIEIPPTLEAILKRPKHITELDPKTQELKKHLSFSKK